MSKLIDRLNQVAKAVPQPIGFRATPPAPKKSKVLLIASVAQANNVDRLPDDITGADAVLITKPSSGARAVPKITRSLADIPWGLRLGDSDEKVSRPMIAAGGDFVVFPTGAALTIPEDEKVGKVLQVAASLSEDLLKAVNELPVDAVLLTNEPEDEHFLTWHHLMLFQRFADLLAKPLLVSVPSNVTANELQLIWKTGADGVVVEAGQVGKLKELRQTIDKLTFPTRTEKKAAALLPYISEKVSPVTETEEEEEEEEI